MASLTLLQTIRLLEAFATEAYVLSITETTPPVGPSTGDAYIPVATATGDWASQEEKIVVYLGDGWYAMTPSDGMKAYVVDEDATYQWDGANWAEVTGAGSGAVGESVTQVAHGLSAGNAAYFNGTNWVKAKADAQSTLGTHLVSAVADVDNFTVTQAGKVTGLSGLTAGTFYFVSAATAGALTSTEPATYSNPILFATSTTAGYVLPWRASTVSSGAADILSRWTAASASGAASLDFHEDTDNGTNKATVQGPAALGSDVTITLPSATGTLLGTGATVTVAQGGTGNTSYSANRVPYSNGTILTSAANFTFDGTTLTTPGQIAFPATQSASSDANTLDDYEEGTWTPTIQDSSFSDSESQTYTTQVGWYRKIGSLVVFGCLLETLSLGTLTTTQSARIAGLPFTPLATANTGGGMIGTEASALAITAGTCLVCKISEGNARVIINNWDAATGTTGLTLAKWSADGKCSFVGSYIADA